MELYDRNNNIVLDVKLDDNSYRIKEVMGDNKLFLYFALNTPINLPLYSYCTFKAERYFLMNPENFKKIHSENHEFVLELDTYIAYLKTQKFEFFTVERNGSSEEINSDREIEFTLNLTPQGYAQLLVDNMNQKDSERGWTVGECIEASPVVIDFNDAWCFDVLGMIADKFSTEWEVEGKSIHFRKVEKMKDNPLALMYGKDRGILSGLERTNYKNRIGAVRVKTSSRNIDKNKYGSKYLKMPKNYTINYNGIDYITDKTGSVLTRSVPLFNTPIIEEETLDLTRIYPKHEGTITSVVEIDDTKSLYDIIDSSNAINYEENVIPGETLTVSLIDTGIPELEAKYIHTEKKFELVPTTQSGVNYPQRPYVPKVGGKYAVFNITLPQVYINNTEMEVLNETVKFLYENENHQYTYKTNIDPLFSSRRWGEVGGYFNIGYFIRLAEPQYLSEPVDIRVISVKDYVNRPHSPELLLSNSVTGKTKGSIINELPSQEQTINRNKEESISYTKRRYRDAEEHLTLVENAVKGMGEGISPAWIHTLAGLFGHDTLQFRFVNSKTNPQAVDSGIRYDNTAKVLTAPRTIIQHMTIGIHSLSPTHSVDEYSFWDMQPYTSAVLDTEAARYVYAKCSKTSSVGSFLVSETPFDFDNTDGHYYLLIGTISSEYNDYRSYVECYGFTEILPGRITLWKIIDPDGFQFWDMLTHSFRIGNANNYLAYNINQDGKLVLKGAMVQSPGGNTDYIGVDRGNWSSSKIYYPGDSFKYTTNGNVYKTIRQAPAGTLPTNTTYFNLVVSKGDPGKPGDPGTEGTSYEYAYYPSGSTTPPAAPTGIGGDWWSYPPPNSLYKYIYVSQRIKKNGVWGSFSYPSLYSVRSEDGAPGALIHQHEWKQGATYVRNKDVIDYIAYQSTPYATPTWWRLKIGVESYVAGASPNTTYFEQISSYEAIATNILLANEANIASWIFKNGILQSQAGNAYLDGINGLIKAGSDTVASLWASGGRGIIEITDGNDSLNKISMEIYNNTSGERIGKLFVGKQLDGGYGNTGISVVKNELWYDYRGVEKFSIKYDISTGKTILRLNNLPTSSSGLSSGTVWRNGNVLNIV
ncbi:hypothetical protein LJC38_00055 [Parabacteroides sp. OttesenSCG-928-K15]|nr:hypothetical protein [Parabacteroides sp. OttesenSCG-928-K15]